MLNFILVYVKVYVLCNFFNKYEQFIILDFSENTKNIQKKMLMM